MAYLSLTHSFLLLHEIFYTEAYASRISTVDLNSMSSEIAAAESYRGAVQTAAWQAAALLSSPSHRLRDAALQDGALMPELLVSTGFTRAESRKAQQHSRKHSTLKPGASDLCSPVSPLLFPRCSPENRNCYRAVLNIPVI